MVTLSRDDMLAVSAACQEALETTFNQYPENHVHGKLLPFVARIIMEEKPYLWFSTEGMAHLIDFIYEKEEHRDFVHTFQFQFLARWGEAPTKYEALVHSLAWACGVAAQEVSDKDGCLVPQELRARMPSRQVVLELMQENTWVTCLVVLRTFAVLDTRQRAVVQRATQAEPSVTRVVN